MVWLVAIIASIAFGYLMFSNERFRRFGFGVIALLLAGIALLWAFSEHSNRQFQQERQRALSAIQPSDLTFSNLALIQESYGTRIRATVLNRSAYPLRAMKMTISQRECPASTSEAGCITTGEAQARFYVHVPPGQARQLDTIVTFDNAAAPHGHWGWVYRVDEVEAEL